jgi:preprotein translocase subunit SecY
MVESLRNIFQVGELRNRVLFTLGLLAVYRIGNHIVVPGVNTEALALLAEQARNTMFGLYDMFSGQNLSKMTIFALGIMPYISASIIIQLLTVVSPYLEKLSKEGELGRRKITQYTRYGTIGLAVIQAASIAVFLERQTDIAGGLPLVYDAGWGFRFMTVLTLTVGSALVMWLGEQITERGIGNGMSLIIFAGIVVGLPRAVITTFEQLSTGQMSLLRLILLALLMVAVIAAIIFVERGQRRVTVQYAKRLVGRRMYGGTSTHIPLKVNTGGVIPVIFASSILAFPATVAGMFEAGGWGRSVVDQLAYGMPLYNLLYVSGIIFFAYFYTAIIFNPDDVADRGVHRHDPRAHHARRRVVSMRGRAPAGIPADGLQGGADPVGWRIAGRGVAAVVHAGHGRDVLFRRHVAVDRCGCGHGHCQPGGVAAHHAAL